MISFLLYSAVVLAGAVAAVLVQRRDLTMFQQNSYRSDRYRRWMNEAGESTSSLRLGAIAAFLFALIPWVPPKLGIGVAAVYFVCAIVTLARRKYKKPLVMTARAGRIFGVVCCLGVLVCAGVSMALMCKDIDPLFTATEVLLAICACPYAVIVADFILTPIEKSITRRYYDDAAALLKAMPGLKIIGITGSYGKTTTKHYLQRILSEKFETLMTPGSFNTTLGVVRTVREHLKPYHEVFIVEMGAKQPGDIKEICDLVHPHNGIITAVGPQHLESFKSLENVQRTKFELIDALPPSGTAVLNNDFDMIASRPVENTNAIRYAIKNEGPGADYRATDLRYSPAGTHFTVQCPDGTRLDLHTRLVGECNISNVLAAVAMARSLGVPDNKIAYAVERLEQVEHRLSTKRTPGGVTIIDDAFNSNPVGSAMALDVLAAMTGGKRILVTPGMIELGDEQFELNRRFGLKAASCCDIAIVVGHYNREAICRGLEEGGMPAESIVEVDSFAEAQQRLAPMLAPGATILYENDLPDTFK